MRFLSTISLSVAIALTFDAYASAQNAGTQNVGTQNAAAKYLSQSNILLAKIDVAKVNAPESAKWVATMQGRDLAEEDIARISGIVNTLKTAGVSNLYAVASASSLLEGGPVVIIPCQDTAPVKGVVDMIVSSLPGNPKQSVHVGDGVVLVGPQVAIDRTLKSGGADRKDLTDFLRGKTLDHSVSISLPIDVREDLQSLWPTRMPGVSPIQLSPRELVADVQHLGVSWTMPPALNVQATIQTPTEEAMQRVRKVVDQAIGLSPDFKSAFTVQVAGTELVVSAKANKIAALFREAVAPARDRAEKLSRMNDVKQVMLAFHNYAASNQHLPPRCYVDKAKQPLHSWRTMLLPYLDQAALHKQMKLDQPWNSPQNAGFSKMAIPVFNSTMRESKEPWKTTMRAPVFPGSIWAGEGEPLTFRDIKDGTSNTIAFIVASKDHALSWASSEPWTISKDDPMKDIFGDQEEVLVGMMDGSARVLARDGMTNDRLKALLTYAGGEVVQR